jgi:hypothetical protein
MQMFTKLFGAPGEECENGHTNAASSGVLPAVGDEDRDSSNNTAASSRVPSEVEGTDRETGSGDAASSRVPPEVEGAENIEIGRDDAARSGVPPEVTGHNVAPRSPVAGPRVARPPAVGSGTEQPSVNDHVKEKNAGAKTACHGKGKATATPVGTPKTKAKAKAKAKQAKKGKPATIDAGAKEKADAKADAKSRARRGTAGTFAGRRPPNDAIKRAVFDQMKSSYTTLRLHGLSDLALSDWAGSPMKKACTKVSAQNVFIKAMQTRMAELATAGVPGPDRMITATAELKAHNGSHRRAVATELAGSEASSPMAKLL